MKTENLQELGQWKVGQKVLMLEPYDRESIRTITKITSGRNGTIYVGELDSAFDINGNQRGSGVWSRTYIQPATAEDIEKIRCRVIKRYLSTYNWSTLTNAQTFELNDYLISKGINIKEFKKNLTKT